MKRPSKIERKATLVDQLYRNRKTRTVVVYRENIRHALPVCGDMRLESFIEILNGVRNGIPKAWRKDARINTTDSGLLQVWYDRVETEAEMAERVTALLEWAKKEVDKEREGARPPPPVEKWRS